MADVLKPMEIGALTAVIPDEGLELWANRAQENKLGGLEVACHEMSGTGQAQERKDFVAATLDLREQITSQEVERVQGIMGPRGLKIFSLGIYENMLHNEIGQKNIAQLKRVIHAAGQLGVPYVSTFVGIDPILTVQQNIKKFGDVFNPIIDYARSQGVKIAIENCPMEGWIDRDFRINNLMCTPRLWDACFEKVSTANADHFGLEFDPSHLIWMYGGRMDLVEKALDTYAGQGKVYLIHGKGASLDDDGLYMDTHMGKFTDLAHPWEKVTSYEHAIPGASYDAVKWNNVIYIARKHGVGAINIEIEDPLGKDMKDAEQNRLKANKAVQQAAVNLLPLVTANDLKYVA